MTQTEKAANAVSGRTARACDSCLRSRARWYCAEGDAFLCQACDASVHSANPLARRHDRVRLKTASSTLLSLPPADLIDSATPAWHRGFKRKARTPRHQKNSAAKAPMSSLVPDLDDGKVEEEEEQLLYQVPVFDPVLSKFEETKAPVAMNNQNPFAGFGLSDLELAEFSADVKNLLGQGLDDDAFCIDGLGLLEAREYGDVDRSQVKTEMADGSNATLTNGAVDDTEAKFLVDMEMEFSRESLDFNFDCGSAGEEVEKKKVETGVGLRLDYKAAIAEWSCRGCSPWTDGERLPYNLHDCWHDFTGLWGSGGEQQGVYGEIGIGAQVGNIDGGREVRVSRYREKRRTRLFSKKIRYEVRKLNAEKRPRMKGRFVKRASFPAASAVAVAGGDGGGATASSTGAFAFV